MAHPKKRHPKSRTNKRRSHHALEKIQVQKAEDGRGYRLPHHEEVIEV